MLNVYVLRHGETEWNAEKRMQGRLDSALTEKGINDARLLGERLKEIDFQRIISSPSNRTMQTAQLVKGEKPNLIETDERLMEIDLGEWQGQVEGDIKERYPIQFDLYWNQPALYESVGGESFLDVKERVSLFLRDLERRNHSGNILVVTHAVVVKALYLLCRNATVNEIWDPPFIHGTSLTIIRMHDGNKELLLEGCMAHCR